VSEKKITATEWIDMMRNRNTRGEKPFVDYVDPPSKRDGSPLTDAELKALLCGGGWVPPEGDDENVPYQKGDEDD
jgi:hypothetical protein